MNALTTAVAEFERLVGELGDDQEPSLEDLGGWAQALWQVNHAQGLLARTLLDRERALGDRYVLRDDRGETFPPEETVIAAIDSLRSMETQVGQADAAAYDHRTRIGHLFVERTLEPGEDPSFEVRRSTAAKMALRERSSYQS